MPPYYLTDRINRRFGRVGLGPQLKLDYSAKQHKGFDHVIPRLLRGGKPVPFTDQTVVREK
jgi:hypothetical protein